jgi:phenylalanyl-tRNA synthetase beta chain
MNLDLGSTFGFQFDLNKVMALANEKVTYQSIATYPMVERDLNFVVNEEMLVGEINRTIINNGRSILKKVEAVNVFRHESVGKGKKAVAFNLVFQSSSKTLEDKDVNPVIDEIIRVVSKKYSANLR